MLCAATDLTMHSRPRNPALVPDTSGPGYNLQVQDLERVANARRFMISPFVCRTRRSKMEAEGGRRDGGLRPGFCCRELELREFHDKYVIRSLDANVRDQAFSVCRLDGDIRPLTGRFLFPPTLYIPYPAHDSSVKSIP
ncbi:hypothetical protein KSP40_PGU001449 [Platanthera guangdongensis]|uniref:Uncharacterized protein n=1 Tax=Platanthera guangdongensis TaxID=2320717 RepID=A0ABR2M9T0_9ASPA